MPQMQLPMFPAGLTAINPSIAFQNEGGRVVYFYGHLAVFQHEAGDVQSFRLFTSQLIQQGSASQTEIVEAFGVPRITVKRYAKLLREFGEGGFRTAESPLGSGADTVSAKPSTSPVG